MDIAIFTQAAQLGGTVFTVVAFLWYLSRRDNHWTDSLKDNSIANLELAKALQKLTDIIENNSIINRQNTGAVQDNTVATDKSTAETKITNGKHV